MMLVLFIYSALCLCRYYVWFILPSMSRLLSLPSHSYLEKPYFVLFHLSFGITRGSQTYAVYFIHFSLYGDVDRQDTPLGTLIPRFQR